MQASELIKELEEEVKELMDSITELEEEMRENLRKAETVYIAGYMAAGGDSRDAFKAWLDFAIREGWHT